MLRLNIVECMAKLPMNPKIFSSNKLLLHLLNEVVKATKILAM